jgi:hypothetical protein
LGAPHVRPTKQYFLKLIWAYAMFACKLINEPNFPNDLA